MLHIFAISIPATMATAVAFDLLARPGSLAIGERAGLIVRPRPLHAVGTRIEVFRRYRELVQLAREEGFGPFSAGGARAQIQSEASGTRLRRVLERAGGVYVKLGQIAATRVDLLPPDVCAELAKLQNRVAPEPAEQIKAVLEDELGASAEELFAEFDWEPLAAASIGQTYRARLHSGEPVVVKVQRPGIEEVIERDLAALQLLAGLAQRRTPFGQGIRSGEMLDQFARSLRAELDFRQEADSMAEMAASLDSQHGPRAEGLWPPVDPSPARAGALRGCHRRRHRRARGAARSIEKPSPPSSCDRSWIRSCGSASSTPTRTRATCSCSPMAASG